MKYIWSYDDSLPDDWKIRDYNGRTYIMSPIGKQYLNRVNALIDIIRNKGSEEDINALKENLHHEGWQRSELIPQDWFYKVFDGKNSSQQNRFGFLTVEGHKFSSFKVAIAYLKHSPTYNNRDIVNILKLRLALTKDLSKKKYDWKDEASLPGGWKKRPTTNKEESDTLISPDGTQFRSRVSALQFMINNHSSLDDIEMMKAPLLKEGWKTNDLMPDNWIFRKIWEGKNDQGKLIHTYHYIADDGKLFKTGEAALEYLESSSVDYTPREVENFNEFLNDLWQSSIQSYQWIHDNSIPKGWKKRVVGTDREYLLSPEERTFSTRFSAFKHMIEEDFSDAEVKEMRSKLCYEGWNEDSTGFLPKGWLYKLYYTNQDTKPYAYKFISKENEIHENLKQAVQFMRENKYSKMLARRCKKFFIKSIKSRDDKIVIWNSGDPEAPYGWKTRSHGNGSKSYLLPNKREFPSMFSAFKHMVNNDYLLSQVNVVKSYLVYEGWGSSEHIPEAWMVKKVSEKLFWFIGKYGEFLQSVEKALDYMNILEDCDNFDKEAFKRHFNENEEDPRVDTSKNATKIQIHMKLDWQTHPKLPSGWKVRREMKTSGEKTGSLVDTFMSPDNTTISGRREAGQWMIDSGYPQQDVEKIWRFSWTESVNNCSVTNARGSVGVAPMSRARSFEGVVPSSRPVFSSSESDSDSD